MIGSADRTIRRLRLRLADRTARDRRGAVTDVTRAVHLGWSPDPTRGSSGIWKPAACSCRCRSRPPSRSVRGHVRRKAGTLRTRIADRSPASRQPRATAGDGRACPDRRTSTRSSRELRRRLSGLRRRGSPEQLRSRCRSTTSVRTRSTGLAGARPIAEDDAEPRRAYVTTRSVAGSTRPPSASGSSGRTRSGAPSVSCATRSSSTPRTSRPTATPRASPS